MNILKLKSLVVSTLLLTMSIFGIMSVFRTGDVYLYCHTFLVLALLVIFITRPLKISERFSFLRAVDYIFILIVLADFYWVTHDFSKFQTRLAMPNQIDVMLGTAMIVLVLEATRRVVGFVMPLIAICFTLHTLYGNYFPGIFRTAPNTVKSVVHFVYMDVAGIYGIPLLTMASYVMVFLIFAGILNATGVGKYFTDIAIALTANSVGGPAKAAVVASGLMGTISGSAVANVVGTGTFTIPLMKNAGFSPVFAGAVTAVASTGGQFTPPIMGAAAFLIAQFLGVPYSTLIFAAAMPAFLYYFGLFVQIDLHARRQNLPKLSINIDLKKVLRESYLLIPLIALIVFIIMGKSAVLGALYACVVTILVGIVSSPKKFNASALIKALEAGAASVVSVSLCAACAGIIIGSLFISGLGISLTSLLIKLSGGNMFAALIFTAICALILGMGMTTSSVYLTLVVLVIPVLTELGVEKVAAHMFTFYFGCICAITPPVALAAYAAAGISGANENTTGWTAFRLGFAAYIVPFLFVYRPGILFNDTPMQIVLALTMSIVGVFFVATSVEGWFMGKPVGRVMRILCFITGFAFVYPHPYADLFGIILAVILVAGAKMAQRAKNPNIQA